MLIVGLNGEIDQLAMTNSFRWYCHMSGMTDSLVLRKAL